MTDADHAALLDTLKAHRGPVLLSGYESKLYSDTLRDWHRDEFIAQAQTSTNLDKAQGGFVDEL